MTEKPARIVDAHVHLWDPARNDWYPYLSGGMKLDMGDTTGMNRRFDAAIYRAESAHWNVEKIVNVAAAVGVHSVDETLELDERGDADGHPDALIGGLPPTDTVAPESVAPGSDAFGPTAGLLALVGLVGALVFGRRLATRPIRSDRP